MKQFQFISKNEEDTKKFAKSLAPKLKKQDTIILTGNLGSGKTKWVEGILSYFGLENEISSPTFTIVNEYQKENIAIYHFDIYRLENVSEFYEIGGEEYFEKRYLFNRMGRTYYRSTSQRLSSSYFLKKRHRRKY